MEKEKDNIYSIEETRERIFSGIRKVSSIIQDTYGPSGGNTIVEDELLPFHRVSNDGKISIDKIKLADPVENMGANLVKEAANEAEKESGDGRKTTMLLTKAILDESQNVKDIPPVEIKRKLDKSLVKVLNHIDSWKKDIDVHDIGKVATIASENEYIGSLVQEIYEKIGKNGIIEIDNSNTFETTYEIKDGVRLLNCGFLSPYMANEMNKAVYKKPKILITKQKISSINDINPLFEKLQSNGDSEIVIFCDEIDASVAGALVYTHIRGVFKSLIIKAPILWKNWLFEDFAKMTGATIVEPLTGVTLKNVGIEHLGTCEKIITSKEETLVVGVKDLTEHIQYLKEQGTEESNLRASRLQTKAAILKVGANSESELHYISKKARDACNAAYLALQDGVVPGGGIALASYKGDDNDIGDTILVKALQVPMSIIESTTGKSHDSWSESVYDPTIVVKNAVKNAVSIAGTALTIKRAITLPKDTDKKPMPNMPLL